jgi:hypothetical protein
MSICLWTSARSDGYALWIELNKHGAILYVTGKEENYFWNFCSRRLGSTVHVPVWLCTKSPLEFSTPADFVGCLNILLLLLLSGSIHTSGHSESRCVTIGDGYRR